MTVYAIKHTASGMFLPEYRGHGYTWLEPSDGIPRLFRRKKDARTCLTMWAKGKYAKTTILDPDFGVPIQGDVKIVPAGRNVDDFEVVEMILTQKPLSEVYDRWNDND